MKLILSLFVLLTSFETFSAETFERTFFENRKNEKILLTCHNHCEKVSIKIIRCDKECYETNENHPMFREIPKERFVDAFEKTLGSKAPNLVYYYLHLTHGTLFLSYFFGLWPVVPLAFAADVIKLPFLGGYDLLMIARYRRAQRRLSKSLKKLLVEDITTKKSRFSNRIYKSLKIRLKNEIWRIQSTAKH